MKKFYVFGLFLLLAGVVGAQDWRTPMSDPNANFYDIQRKFKKDNRRLEKEMKRERQEKAEADATRVQNKVKGSLAEKEENEEEEGGYLHFKRWEWYMEPRVYPSGDLTLPSTNYDRFMEYLQQSPDAMDQYLRSQGGGNRSMSPNPTIQSSTWTFAGPTGAPTGGGAGRINFVRIDPTNANNIWCGAPSGGLWKSTNGGTSWTTNTDNLAVIGASDVAIDPTNTQIMYLATGDGDAGDTYSVGVLKSTDGGTTWNTTGLNWAVTQGRVIRKLLINPTTPATVMAFSNAGIWRTTDSGVNWTQVSTANVTDAEFMPGTPATVYACGTAFYKSTNSGATWTNITTGVPTAANVSRLAIAVTAANSAYVYMLAGSSANEGFLGFYRSTNSGTSFTQITVSSPSNILGWASAGNDTGGQAWYDLSLDASPTNANEVLAGGVNIWRTTNGGTSWTLNGHWTGSGAPYVHADIHAIVYTSGTTVYVGCDGGTFRTTNNGGAWTDISSNMCIAQPYRIGLSASTANLWLTGHQDNGTNLKNGANYTEVMGGDGMDCFIDRTNNNIMYGEQYNGSFNRSTNGGGTWGAYTTGLTGTAGWVTPWCQDPTNATYLWAGYTNVFRRNTASGNWTQMGTITGSGTIVDVHVAPSNGAYVYAARSNQIWKSTNTGGTWTNITGTLPVGSAAISRFAIDPTDPNTVWVTFSGYSSGNKVYVTTNGGTSWTNFSTGLPNLPANCIICTNGTTDALYVGCDVGVYYRDNSSGTWQPYFTGLPNVPVADLEMYTPTLKLRAATYGRGVWEVDAYNPGTLPPIAAFAPSSSTVCSGSGVNFTDQSSFAPTSWSWTFPSGTPASSTAQNPTGIVWNTPGTYTVTLTATNANGSNSTTQVITVMGTVLPPFSEGFQTTTFVPANWYANDVNADGVYWSRSTAAGGFGTSTASMKFDNYNFDVAGSRDEILSPRLNYTGYTNLQMTFDVAYARYNATYFDTLEVLVSNNCGTYTQVYIKGNSTLATAPDYTTAEFVPTAAQWRTETVNLTAYNNSPSLQVIFRNRGHYGQSIYVDNINITGTVSSPPPTASFTASASTVCAGTAVNFTDASTGSPTSWSWTFPGGTPASATTQNVTGVVWNTAGTYTVTLTATNANGSNSTTQVITVNALPTVTTTATNTTICSGSSTTLTATGASTYTWMPGSLTGSSVTVSPTTTTTYTVTGTNANGCTGTSTRVITVNTSPTVATTTTNATICAGSSTTITATGASTYAWMPGSLTGSSVTVSPTTTTTYTVTGTAANGCTGTSTRLITVNPAPTVSTTASSTTICSGSSTTLTATGANTYTWMPGSLTGSSVTVSPTTTTTYTVTGTNANGCTGTSTRVITVNTSPTVATTTTNATICAGSSTTLTATGASTYAWMPGSLTGSSVTVSPTTTTTYTVTGTAANGCTGTSTRTITVNTAPTVTATASSSTICSSGSTTLTATGASTYAWMPGSLSGSSVTVSPTSTTTYTVTGTAANGCTNTQTVTVTVTGAPTVTATASNGTICSGSSTSLTAGGASTYTWMPGSLSGTTVTVSPTSTTTYTVTGTAPGGCSNTQTVLVTVNPTPTVTTTATSTSVCVGSSTTITASGANTYTWMPGSLSGSSVTVSPTTATTYTVTGTSANGCTATSTRLIIALASPTVTATAGSTTICTGSSTTLTAGGANTYSWMPGSMSGASVSVTPASTTTYTVTGTSGNGCTDTQTVTVTVTGTPTVTATAGNSTICTGGSTTLTAGGANTYTWMPGSLTGSSVTVSPTATTTYTVTGTAPGGCSNTQTVTVTVTGTPTVTATAGNSSICTGSSTTLTGGGASTYSWMPGSLTGSSVTVSPTATTTYTVTGTAPGGCSSTQTVTVTVNNLPTVSATASTSTVCAGSGVTLTGSGASTYSWMPGSLSGSIVTDAPSTTTTYTVTGTDANGCSGTGNVTVTVNPLPTVTLVLPNDSMCLADPASVLSGESPAGGTFTGTGVSGGSFDPAVAGVGVHTITYTYTDGNGCTNTATQNITVDICMGVTVQPVTENGLTIVPNPNNGTFQLLLNLKKKDNYLVEITNELGQIVYKEQIDNASGQLTRQVDISAYGAGAYFVKIKSSSSEQIVRMTVTR